MEQLIQILSERPEIICILLSWPLLLWLLQIISQKILYKYEEK